MRLAARFWAALDRANEVFVFVCGIAIVGLGVGMIYRPAAVIFAGVVLVALAVGSVRYRSGQQ